MKTIVVTLPNDIMFDFSLASEFMVRSPAIVVVPSNNTVIASDLLEESAPFPITKALFAKSKVSGFGVVSSVLNCPIARVPWSLAVVKFPIAVEL